MIQEFDVTPAAGVDFESLVSDWQEYTAMRSYSEFEQFFGDEAVVPIHYEPR